MNQGENVFITSAQEAWALQVIGDWLYYADGGQIYRMRVDGNEKSVYKENIVETPFFVTSERIAYITKENKTASIYDYLLHIESFAGKTYTLNCGE